MGALTDSTIAALRSNRDELAAMVKSFSASDLDRQSGSAEWDVAQVLSHLGSGAQIGLAGLQVALGEREPLAAEFNPSVWDRWNAMRQKEKAESFLIASEELLQAYEALDASVRDSLRFDLGFMPQPVDLALVTGMRLNEAAMHAWDVRIAFDAQATIHGTVAEVLLDQFLGPIAFMLGFFGKPGAIEGQEINLHIETSNPTRNLELVVGDSISLTNDPDETDGFLALPTESLLRLISGRLAPEHTPESVTITGNVVDLDQLRLVFPGY